MKSIFALLLISAFSLSAQPGVMKEDTITTGDGNEYHPALSRTLLHSYRSGRGEWLVFDRQTDDSSFIVAKQFRGDVWKWDSTEVVISRSSRNEPQSRPDISLSGEYGQYGMIAWQKRIAGRWAIMGSTCSPTAPMWSSPFAVTNDTLDNVNVRLQPAARDSHFVAVWQNTNILRLRIVPAASASGSDVFAISNFDSTQFDIRTTNFMSEGALLYTIKKAGMPTVVRIGFITLSGLTVTERDTLQVGIPVFNPRFAQDYSSYGIVFESSGANAQQRNINVSNLSSFNTTQYDRLTDNQDTASYRNASVYMFPVTTQNSVATRSIAYYRVMVAERDMPADTAGNTGIVLMQGERTMSVAGNGYNRNPVIGGIAYSSSSYWWWNGPAVPVVWESNRSGKSHLYGMIYPSQYSLGVEEEQSLQPEFALGQNYPNPFNPATTISFRVPSRAFVSIRIFDLAGRAVADLVSEELPAGRYTRAWNAAGCASGVYFYRLQAGAYTETKRLMLLK